MKDEGPHTSFKMTSQKNHHLDRISGGDDPGDVVRSLVSSKNRGKISPPRWFRSGENNGNSPKKNGWFGGLYGIYPYFWELNPYISHVETSWCLEFFPAMIVEGVSKQALHESHQKERWTELLPGFDPHILDWKLMNGFMDFFVVLLGGIFGKWGRNSQMFGGNDSPILSHIFAKWACWSVKKWWVKDLTLWPHDHDGSFFPVTSEFLWIYVSL